MASTSLESLSLGCCMLSLWLHCQEHWLFYRGSCLLHLHLHKAHLTRQHDWSCASLLHCSLQFMEDLPCRTSPGTSGHLLILQW